MARRAAPVSAVPVRERLARRGLASHRRLGQNFLVDPALAARIAAASGVGADDAVIEIGTGLGILTEALAARARRVVTIEVDAGLVQALRDEAGLPESVELLHADALRLDLAALARELGPRTRLVANLPYSISSPLLRRLLDARDALLDWTVLLQRELARRLLAKSGTKDYGSLTVLHRLVVRVERLFDLPPACFHPRPRVVSTLLRMTPLAPAPVAGDELRAVERVVRAAFGKRRKVLANALGAVVGSGRDAAARLEALGIDPRARAETLEPETFLALARALGPGGA